MICHFREGLFPPGWGARAWMHTLRWLSELSCIVPQELRSGEGSPVPSPLPGIYLSVRASTSFDKVERASPKSIIVLSR